MKSLPHFFTGISFPVWVKLLIKYHTHLKFQKVFTILGITLVSAISHPFKVLEKFIFSALLRRQILEKDPVFILGHWRSGTTLLHNLFALDQKQFAYASNWDVMQPDLNLLIRNLPKLFNRLLPPTRPQDNMPLSFQSPQEEEFALCLLSGISPYTSIAFPHAESHYSTFIHFRDSDPKTIKTWLHSYQNLVTKLSYKYQKRLVLKSPANTGRIHWLLKLYPHAKFIHLVRDPYRIYQSSCHLIETLFPHFYLENVPDVNLSESVLKRGNLLYEHYHQDADLIPAGNLIEMKYEDLVANPVLAMQRIYEKLELEWSDSLADTLNLFLPEHKNYKKNEYQALDDEMKKLVSKAWSQWFKNWNYPV